MQEQNEKLAVKKNVQDSDLKEPFTTFGYSNE